MHTLKITLTLICLLYSTIAFSMDSSSTSFCSDKDDSESSEESSQEDSSYYCRACRRSHRTSKAREEACGVFINHSPADHNQQAFQAMLMRENVIDCAKKIMAFNFASSLGDGLLEHLFREILLLMEKEAEWNLVKNGIFSKRMVRTLENEWHDKFLEQCAAHYLGTIDDQMPGIINQECNALFGQAIDSLNEQLNNLEFLAKSSPIIILLKEHLDAIKISITSVKKKYSKYVQFKKY